MGLGGARLLVEERLALGDALTLSFTAPTLWDSPRPRARVAWVGRGDLATAWDWPSSTGARRRCSRSTSSSSRWATSKKEERRARCQEAAPLLTAVRTPCHPRQHGVHLGQEPFHLRSAAVPPAISSRSAYDQQPFRLRSAAVPPAISSRSTYDQQAFHRVSEGLPPTVAPAPRTIRSRCPGRWKQLHRVSESLARPALGQRPASASSRAPRSAGSPWSLRAPCASCRPRAAASPPRRPARRRGAGACASSSGR